MAVARSVKVRTGTGKFQQQVEIGPHRLIGDEPIEDGGADTGPNPNELLLAALGTCTSMTVSMYAARKSWPLEGVIVELSMSKEDPKLVRLTRRIELRGPLDEEQRTRLLEIANKCPVHKTLMGEIAIDTTLV